MFVLDGNKLQKISARTEVTHKKEIIYKIICLCSQQNYFLEIDKILVCGSHVIQEIIDLIDVEFKYEFFDKRATRHNAVGGILQNKPIMCGGNYLY